MIKIPSLRKLSAIRYFIELKDLIRIQKHSAIQLFQIYAYKSFPSRRYPGQNLSL